MSSAAAGLPFGTTRFAKWRAVIGLKGKSNLETRHGDEAYFVAPQAALLHRARYNHAALHGGYQDTVQHGPDYRLAF